MPERRGTSRKKKQHKPLPFWNEACTQAVYNRNRLRNKAARSKDLADQCKHLDENNKCQKTIKDTARQHWEDFCTTINSQSKLGPIWGMARRMNGGPSQRTMPTLVQDGVQAISNIDKANVLAGTYAQASSTANYAEEFRRHIATNTNTTDTHTDTHTDAHIDTHMEALNDAFNLAELKTAIKGAKHHKAPGEDLIPYEMLQNLHNSAMKVLLRIYNGIWDGGAMPGDWKHGGA